LTSMSRRRAGALSLILAILLMSGCVSQQTRLTSVLSNTDAPTATAETDTGTTPEPVATDEPLVEMLIPSITGAAKQSDGLGMVILDPETHYFSTYLRFTELRVYEHENGVFLDGVCINSYFEPLYGKAKIVFFDENGVEYGYGDIHTADGGTVLASGRSLIYAEILTEVDVQLMDFVIIQVESYAPKS